MRFKIALFPAHPAQLWLMYSIYKKLSEEYQVLWVLRDKDILIELASSLKIEYRVISKAKSGIFGNAFELFSNIFKVILITRSYKVDCWITKYGAGNIGAYLCGVPSISFNDDDIDIVPLIAATSYPFAKYVICPQDLRMGKYHTKALRFKGMNELAYLETGGQTNSESAPLELLDLLGKKYILIRLSALSAHHDVGKRGISTQFIINMLKKYEGQYRIVISSEKPLPKELEDYKLKIPVQFIHITLRSACCLVTDSLSMALESSVLGTGVVRLSDFGGNLTAFQSIESYRLIFNHSPDDLSGAMQSVCEVLELNTTGEMQNRSDMLRADMESPVPLFLETINSLFASSERK